jgi:hypothetical protein
MAIKSDRWIRRMALEKGMTRYVEDAAGNKILTRLDERTLRWVAEATGGSAHRSFTGQELDGFFHMLITQERKIEGFRKVIEHEDVYPWLLLAAFALLFVRLLV